MSFFLQKELKYNFSVLSLSGQDNQDAMDLFGGADDISSGSDGEDKPPTPGQPIVSVFYNICSLYVCGIDVQGACVICWAGPVPKPS